MCISDLLTVRKNDIKNGKQSNSNQVSENRGKSLSSAWFVDEMYKVLLMIFFPNSMLFSNYFAVDSTIKMSYKVCALYIENAVPYNTTQSQHPVHCRAFSFAI